MKTARQSFELILSRTEAMKEDQVISDLRRIAKEGLKSLPGEGVEQAAEAYAERIHLGDIDWNSEQEKQKYIKSHDKSFQELYELTKHNFIAGASWDAGKKDAVELETLKWVYELGCHPEYIKEAVMDKIRSIEFKTELP